MQVHEIHRRTERHTRQQDSDARLRRRQRATMIIRGMTLGLMAVITGVYHWMHSI